MEEVDKGCPMIRMGVSGWVFLLVLAYPGSAGLRAVKRCVCILYRWYTPRNILTACRSYVLERMNTHTQHILCCVCVWDDSRRNCLLAVIQTVSRGYTWHLFFLSLFPSRSHVSFSLFFFVRCPRSLWHYATLITSFNNNNTDLKQQLGGSLVMLDSFHRPCTCL